MSSNQVHPPPLDGITVLDLSRAVAGPFCTMSLADLGARVIKVEEPVSGDETRHWGPPFVDGESAYFLGLNRNKESIELDLKQAEGRETLRRLARHADVLVQNFRPGVVDRLGIGYVELRAENPGLVYASISGFGQTGPDRLKPGYDLIVQAMTGLMHAGVGPGGEPSKIVIPIADILAALFTCQAILAALHQRQRTGEGQHVEVSLLESLLASMCSLTSSYLLSGEEPAPGGIAQSNIVPYQIVACEDVHIVVAVPNDRIWQRFCKALDRQQWLIDERYQSNGNRNRYRQDLVPEIEAIFRSRPAAAWLAILEQHEIPCSPILSVGEVFRHRQVEARGSAVEVEHSKLGPIRVVASPMRFSRATLRYQPPPELGQHTAPVLREVLNDGDGDRPGQLRSLISESE